jgi:hypothetical protein
MLSAFLPNGLALDRPLPQVLEAQQHGEHPFLGCLAECLLADQGPVRHFLLAGLEPRQHLAFEEAPQSIGIGGGGRLRPPRSRARSAPR